MAKTGERQMLGHNAYRSILEFIRDGVYPPGGRLREEEVAERLGISRTPVREALGRLQQKGLLQAAPGRGLAIATLDTEQVFELYAMRGELEALVAQFAAQHATNAEIANLQDLNAEFAAATSPREAAKLNRSFHARLYDAARNRYLRAAVEDLQETIALLPKTTFSHENRLESAAREHSALIKAISSRDAHAAADVARDHISRSLATRLAMIRAAVA
ncbi:GntR family transcriptional regulator (plasmid) [Rhizobium leguminosarum]|jgi:DNA-binding GntR family transcriptional regulator|uniref:GntR family transcriptional regulator n=3 Tax=Rhizobium leguminosarum TaxID=384 RepID=A0A2L1CNQ3_RHILV|nr:GntR family transcriptional regulator [Rhizobium leguminosarum]MDH6661894.1 DNA-binding GntR family transcriptional regulator [Rhizobium sophorae]AVC46348.1 bacterial regulatory, gntR family protein [Rhizobium leguminosarum bv. viciae]MBB4524925.1 DNA-binding GntR family transcriptional regulator [Rhizobium leguminosarum]MBP2490741.1 DNA-binding GntR family transcriptional regulator [Rhizobium leguminosarum]MBY5474430.1 GntR family transcriptional regulator [Rhizobium leguminosarum]